MKKKTPATKRVRRSPYERSLDHATKRLEKAIAEQMQAQSDLAALAIEIPRLQGIIRALTPEGLPPLKSPRIGDYRTSGKYQTRHGIDRATGAEIVVDQAEFLRRFPVSSAIGSQTDAIIPPSDDEPFIPDINQGEELLP